MKTNENSLKTFKDLKFKPHPIDPNGLLARFYFDNGYGISVCRFFGSYKDNHHQWEIAVLSWDEETKKMDLCYDTPITNDVIGYLYEDEVSKIMEDIQLLPKITYKNINLGEKNVNFN
jgi:hypothetical protein